MRKPVTQNILCLIFSLYIRTKQCLKYCGQESKKQSAVYDSDTLVTLKQGQGHQTLHELVGSKQGDNNAKFEKPCFKSVHEKANGNVFDKSGNTSLISLECMCKSKTLEYLSPA